MHCGMDSILRIISYMELNNLLFSEELINFILQSRSVEIPDGAGVTRATVRIPKLSKK
jgi:hypothetical protein